MDTIIEHMNNNNCVHLSDGPIRYYELADEVTYWYMIIRKQELIHKSTSYNAWKESLHYELAISNNVPESIILELLLKYG